MKIKKSAKITEPKESSSEQRNLGDYFLEYTKCKESFHYFCPKYIYLELAGGDKLFTPYKKQTELIDTVLEDKHVIVLKSRQIGISTIIKAFVVWLTVFHDNVIVGIVSKDAGEATSFYKTIIKMIEKLPIWLRPDFEYNNQRSFRLTNGSESHSAPVAPSRPDNTLRGKTITFLVIDEAAFVRYIDIAWTSMVPTLSTNQLNAMANGVPYGTIVLSTPNKPTGTGAWFYENYMNAEFGDGVSDDPNDRSFVPFRIHWSEIEELANNPSWYGTICKLFNNDKKRIAQELDLKFISTEGGFIPEDTASRLQSRDMEPIEVVKIFNGEIWKFSDPVPGKYYLIGVDTATEFGHDRSAIEVFDYITMEQVWEYSGKCSVEDFIKIVQLAATIYHGQIIIENNSYGLQVVKALRNVSMSMSIYNSDKSGTKPGFSTNLQTRPLMLEALYNYITTFPETVNSKRLSLELVGLVVKPK